MIASNLAVRLGLRAASRNPELAFGRALIDQGGALLGALPAVLAGLLLAGALDADLGSFFDAISALRWPVLGAVVVALAISFAAGAVFWAGALPLLAADIEVDRRPPPGNFALLAARGFARVLAAAFLSQLLWTLILLAFVLALAFALPVLWAQPSPGRFAAVALVGTGAFGGALVVDLLSRFWLLRAAAFGEWPAAAFGKAASLFSARFGQGLVVTLAFFLLEAIAAAVSAGIGGAFSGPALLGPETAVLALAPRIALGLAFAAVFSWLEVGRMGALAAIACDVEGLLGPEPEPEALPVAEPVVEALPVEDE